MSLSSRGDIADVAAAAECRATPVAARTQGRPPDHRDDVAFRISSAIPILDMELPAADCFGRPLAEALDQGLIATEVVDTAVRRVLRPKFSLGLFQEPYVAQDSAAAVYDTPARRALARRAVAESVVVLTNPDQLLPLGTDIARIAVIGPGAADRRLLQGDYHYPAHPEIVYESGAAELGAAVAGGGAPAGGAGAADERTGVRQPGV